MTAPANRRRDKDAKIIADARKGAGATKVGRGATTRKTPRGRRLRELRDRARDS